MLHASFLDEAGAAQARPRPQGHFSDRKGGSAMAHTAGHGLHRRHLCFRAALLASIALKQGCRGVVMRGTRQESANVANLGILSSLQLLLLSLDACVRSFLCTYIENLLTSNYPLIRLYQTFIWKRANLEKESHLSALRGSSCPMAHSQSGLAATHASRSVATARLLCRRTVRVSRPRDRERAMAW